MLPFPYASDRVTHRVPYATFGLMAVNILVFIGMQGLITTESVNAAVSYFGFVPSQGKWYALFTSMFMHESWAHLVFNMLYLWVFGSLVEDVLGIWVFLVFCVGSQFAATLLHSVMAQRVAVGLDTPVIGISGAVAGLLGLAAVRFSRTRLKMWLLRPLEIPAVVFLGCWLGLQLYGGLSQVGWSLIPGHGSGAGVAYWAHIGGFLFGVFGALALNLRQEGRQEHLLDELKRNPLAITGYDVTTELEGLAGDRPDDPEVHHALARQYMLARQPQVAGKAYMRATGLYVRSGDLQAAVETYTELLACFPDCILPLKDQFGIACALEQLGKYGLALQAFDKLANSYPGTSEAETALVRAGQLCSSKMGNPRLAGRFFASLLEQYPATSWRHFAEQRIAELGDGSLRPLQ